MTFKGVTLNLGGKDYIVPPLSLGSAELRKRFVVHANAQPAAAASSGTRTGFLACQHPRRRRAGKLVFSALVCESTSIPARTSTQVSWSLAFS